MNKPLPPSRALNDEIAGSYLKSARLPAQARVVLQMLRRLEHGSLRLECPDGNVLHFGDDGAPVTLTLHSWEPCIAVMKSGDIGFAESFISKQWRTDDLTGLLDIFIHNRTALETAIYGTWWGSLVYRIRHLLNRNSRAGSRRNIHAHYDIGNRFYQLWLDPSMTYSSALFSNATASLQEAQTAKYQRIFDELQVSAGDHLLEIGCGWGGFAELAAGRGTRSAAPRCGPAHRAAGGPRTAPGSRCRCPAPGCRARPPRPPTS
jgi:cyclopropane-fatty-acyl-phospholipid synthase